MWTRFMDMHSGGDSKETYEYIYIEAPQEEAVVIFYNRFGHPPNRVTCTCCGEDYSYVEYPTLEQATGYDRGCYYDSIRGYIDPPKTRTLSKPYKTLAQYKTQEDVLIIPASEIKKEERLGEIPQQGYIWID